MGMAGGFAVSGCAADPFTFITKRPVVAQNSGSIAEGLKKPFFQATGTRVFAFD
jgi:hypothetical protein